MEADHVEKGQVRVGEGQGRGKPWHLHDIGLLSGLVNAFMAMAMASKNEGHRIVQQRT
jgi:hypothetical protein